MPISVYDCQCPTCLQGSDQSTRELHHQMNVFLSRLNEQQRRWYVALESKKVGHGGDTLLAQITGLDVEPIRRGGTNLRPSWFNAQLTVSVSPEGAALSRKKDPELKALLTVLVEPETAGDPMSDQKWQRSSLRHLSVELSDRAHPVSPPTVRRLLNAMDYSLKANDKRLAGKAHPDREAQFAYIEQQTQTFLAAGWPVISVDTKKKELIGNFKNAGRAWCLDADPVNDHDFEQDALGKAVPYGLYLLNQNRGYVLRRPLGRYAPVCRRSDCCLVANRRALLVSRCPRLVDLGGCRRQ